MEKFTALIDKITILYKLIVEDTMGLGEQFEFEKTGRIDDEPVVSDSALLACSIADTYKAREFLIGFMRCEFKDKTFERYIKTS